jgi:hypothetical protein
VHSPLPKSLPDWGGTCPPPIPPVLGGYLGAISSRYIFELDREELQPLATLRFNRSGDFTYERRRPETGTLDNVVRDNLQTLYAAAPMLQTPRRTLTACIVARIGLDIARTQGGKTMSPGSAM